MIRTMTTVAGSISQASTYLNRQGEARIQLTANESHLTLFLDVEEALRLIKILGEAVVTAQALKHEVAA